MVKETETKIFQTVDLFVVAYLFIKGFTLFRSPHPNVKKTLIVYDFEETPELKKAMEELSNGRSSVEPLSILERYRSLKTQSWEIKRRLKDDGEMGGSDHE